MSDMTGTRGLNGSLQVWLAVAQQRLPLARSRAIAFLLLGLFLLNSLAQLAWLWLPNPVASIAQAPGKLAAVSPAAKAAAVIDLPRLQSLNLFGVAGAVTDAASVPAALAPIEVEAQKTRLDLQLLGIVYASQPGDARAIIAYQGREDHYQIGDKLPVGSRASLARVLVDHVIIDNNGRYESLWLYDKNASATRAVTAVEPPATSTEPRAAMRDLRGSSKVTAMARGYKQRLYKNPESLAQVLTVIPAETDGRMVGYRISPGSDYQQFVDLGLQAGDVVTAINDVALDDPARALELYKTLRSATEASVTIQRGEQTLQLMLALDGE